MISCILLGGACDHSCKGYPNLDESHMNNHVMRHISRWNVVEDVFHLITRQQYFLYWTKRKSKGVYVGRRSRLIIFLIHFHEGMQKLRGSKSITKNHNDRGSCKEHYDSERNIYIMENYHL